MGGVTGIATGNTKVEVREAARNWYNRSISGEYEMYPRFISSDLSDKSDIEKAGCEVVSLVNNCDSVLCIKLLDKFKDTVYYKMLDEKEKHKKFGCIVSVHS